MNNATRPSIQRQFDPTRRQNAPLSCVCQHANAPTNPLVDNGERLIVQPHPRWLIAQTGWTSRQWIPYHPHALDPLIRVT